MNNYYRTILINLHRIIYYVVKARIWMRHPERHSEEERYNVAREMVTKMNKSAGYNTIAYGTEPSDSWLKGAGVYLDVLNGMNSFKGSLKGKTLEEAVPLVFDFSFNK